MDFKVFSCETIAVNRNKLDKMLKNFLDKDTLIN